MCFCRTITGNNVHPKTSYAPASSISAAAAARSIRRPTGPASSSSKLPTPSSPLPPPVEAMQIPPPANNKADRRLSRLHVVQQSSAHSNAPPPPPAPPAVPEPPPSIGLNGPFGQMILDYRSTVTYTPITQTNSHQQQNNQKDLRICVAVRKRPLNKRELAKKDNDVITIPNRDHCLVHVPKSKVDLTKYLDHQTFK